MLPEHKALCLKDLRYCKMHLSFRRLMRGIGGIKKHPKPQTISSTVLSLAISNFQCYNSQLQDWALELKAVFIGKRG